MRRRITWKRQNVCIVCGDPARNGRSSYCQACIDKILREELASEQPKSGADQTINRAGRSI